MSDDPPKRRWYQFSLMTLLVVMTLFTLGAGALSVPGLLLAIVVALGAFAARFPGDWLGGRLGNKASFAVVWFFGFVGGTLTMLLLQFIYYRVRFAADIWESTWLTCLYAGILSATFVELIIMPVMYFLGKAMNDSSKPDRRTHQISRRKKLLIVMTLIMIGIGWVGFRRHQTWKLVAEIERLGGEAQVESAGFVGIVKVNLYRTNATDADLEHLNLKGLTNLRELNLIGTGVSDDGVKNLQEALPNCKIFISHPME